MQLLNSDLATPVYLKTEGHMEWPKDKMFYLLSRDGLFICRNHLWFRSCSPASTGPSDLAEQKAEITLSYPILPRSLIEKAVGFFRKIYDEKHWESALILLFNRATQQLELLCPAQKASYGSVNYEIPALPPNTVLVGDLHSHCGFSPEPSYTDENDELNRPGLHIVAGYLDREKPEFCCIVVADGTRFRVNDPGHVMEAYVSSHPADAPQEWVDKVKPKYESNYSYSGSGHSYTSYSLRKPNKDDKEIIKRALCRFLEREICPDMTEVRQELFRSTKDAGYLYCEKKAQKFVKHWKQAKAHYDRQKVAA